jgi:hypothetical protein
MKTDRELDLILEAGRGPAPESLKFRERVNQSGDSRLQGQYEQQQRLWAALDFWEPVEPSPDFDRRLRARIEDLRASQPWYERFLPVLRLRFALALAGLVVVAASVLHQQPRTAILPALADNPQMIEELDQALDDAEMLADFEALPLATRGGGRS